MSKKAAAALIASALLSISLAAPAHAASHRAWVSGHGVDSLTCGGVTTPCRQIAYVLANNIIVLGGEVDILDPSGFLPFTITQAVSIVNDGVGTASIQQADPAQNSITINAGPADAVHLRGLSLDGLGTGNAGVFLNSAGSLSITDCVARHFSNAGIWVQPSSNIPINISKVIASDNGQYGIIFIPTSFLFTPVVSQSNIYNNGSAGIMLSNYLTVSSILVSIINNTFSNNGNGVNVAHYGDISTYGNSTSAFISKNYFETAWAGNGATTQKNIFSVGDNIRSCGRIKSGRIFTIPSLNLV
jgi:hypothetical protein